jgi:4-hydroxy-3-polyprenylbenzoate decarboxylase
MKLLVAVTGASGAIYAKRLLEALSAARTSDSSLEIAVCFSTNGRLVWRHEIGGEPSHGFREFANDDFACSFASGSALWHAVVAVPCSVGRVGRIASGMADDLIARAADVALKERRKLILVVRETPLSLIHLENLLTVARAGAIVLPATPSFYTRPATVDAVVDTVVARVLDQLGIGASLAPRWGKTP